MQVSGAFPGGARRPIGRCEREMKTVHVSDQVLGGNLFADDDGYDVRASARAYAEALRSLYAAEIDERFPGAAADIDVDVQENACGHTRELAVFVSEGGETEEPAGLFEALWHARQALWESFSWAVEA